MSQAGPPLERLLHRLAECPPDFLRPLEELNLIALACDHFRALGAAIPGAGPRRDFAALPRTSLQLVPIVLWLLRDEWFLARPELADVTWKCLQSQALCRLAILVRAEAIVNDPDRREELVRLCLKELTLRPDGESVAQAADRLNSLDSVERECVIQQTRAAEARAREIREAMARKRAEEAAARYSPE